jgi:hypothetical protein
MVCSHSLASPLCGAETAVDYVALLNLSTTLTTDMRTVCEHIVGYRHGTANGAQTLFLRRLTTQD